MSASAAIAAMVALLAEDGITASDDASTFDPSPIGVLVGLPSRVNATLGGVVYELPVLVVSGDAVNNPAAVDRLYAEADAVANAARTDRYRPTSWAGSSRTEPLPAIEVVATVTVTNQED